MRINVVDVSLLTDQHLRAEYNEIYSMMIPYYMRTMNSKLVKAKGFDDARIPDDYTLSTGHATFFMNKMLFVKKRFESVSAECKYRGFNVKYDTLDISSIPLKHCNDYIPTKKAILTNLERIKLRISIKPHWYKFYGYNWDMISVYEKYENEIKG